MCSSGWLCPSCLSGWASFLVRPGFPPKESWGSRVIVFKITSVCYLAEQELIRGAGLYCVSVLSFHSPRPPTLGQQTRSASKEWVLWARRCLPLPALASSVQFFYLTGSDGQAWSIASSLLLSSPLPSGLVPLTGCKLGCSLWWESCLSQRFPASCSALCSR